MFLKKATHLFGVSVFLAIPFALLLERPPPPGLEGRAHPKVLRVLHGAPRAGAGGAGGVAGPRVHRPGF